MNNKQPMVFLMRIIAACFLLWAAGTGCATASPASLQIRQEKPTTDPVDQVLEKLHKSILDLKSYQGQIEYKFIQPALFDSQDLRKGILYYAKEGNKSELRVNFQTRKQDEEPEHKYIEQYIVLDGASLAYPGRRFEGTWLVCIDYQVEEVKLKQLAEPSDPNKPMDVFELASKYLPLVGFTKTEELKEQFEINLVEQKSPESKDFIQVHLKVRPDSMYKDDYTSIVLWIDKKINLPAEIVAQTTEGDIYEIKFLKPKINQTMNKKVFDFTLPKGFGEPEIISLKEKDKQ
jgi:hypothetical protein